MRVLITGAGGFIGSHLAIYLGSLGYEVFGVDIKEPEFNKKQVFNACKRFFVRDLRFSDEAESVFHAVKPEHVYHLAADMGGIGYITGPEITIYKNNTRINLNVLELALESAINGFLFTSSACVYPEALQMGKKQRKLAESDALPAAPDTLYGWEKLMMERLMLNAAQLDGFHARIARLHNVYGPEGVYKGGREKAPAAICRKVATEKVWRRYDEVRMEGDSGTKKTSKVVHIPLWGDGTAVRSFLYVNDCVKLLHALMDSGYTEPLNIGSEEAVTMLNLAQMVGIVAKVGVTCDLEPDAPVGVKYRNSDNTLCHQVLGKTPRTKLIDGLRQTYPWIEEQVTCDLER
jgi:GDP-D-mannose 3',5'-epimerase